MSDQGLHESLERVEARRLMAIKLAQRDVHQADIEILESSEVVYRDGGYWVAARIWVDMESVEHGCGFDAADGFVPDADGRDARFTRTDDGHEPIGEEREEDEVAGDVKTNAELRTLINDCIAYHFDDKYLPEVYAAVDELTKRADRQLVQPALDRCEICDLEMLDDDHHTSEFYNGFAHDECIEEATLPFNVQVGRDPASTQQYRAIKSSEAREIKPFEIDQARPYIILDGEGNRYTVSLDVGDGRYYAHPDAGEEG